MRGAHRIVIAMLCAGGALGPGSAPALSHGLSLQTQVSLDPGPAAVSPLVTLPVPAGETDIGPISGSDDTIVAEAANDRLVDTTDAKAYAYSKPAQGWSSAPTPARLIPDGGAPAGQSSIAGNSVLVGNGSEPNQSDVKAWVFTRPAAGWSGDLTPSATLSISAPPPAPSTVRQLVAMSRSAAFITSGTNVYAFSEPPGGWSGTRQPTATLQVPGGSPVGGMAVSDDTVVAEQGSSLYVFTEPVDGWTGTITPAARLSIPGNLIDSYRSLAMSSDTIAVGGWIDNRPAAFVYSKRSHGWTVHPRVTQVTTTSYNPYDQPLSVAFAGSTLGLLDNRVGSDHLCPCDGLVYPLTSPVGTWPKSLTLTVPGGDLDSGGDRLVRLAAAGSAFVMTAADGVHVYSTTTPATITAARLTNLMTVRPHLALTTHTGTGTTGLRQITVHLPHGLRLNPKRAQRITIAGVHPRARIIKTRSLSLTLNATKINTKFTITFARGALTKSPSFQRQLRRLTHLVAKRHTGKPAAITTQLAVELHDGVGRTTIGSVAIRISRTTTSGRR